MGIKGLYQLYSELKDPKKVEKELAEGEEPEFTPAPFPGLEVHRIPVTEERSAGEACFDMMTEVLKNEPASVPCIFSDQMGRGRTTSGMVVACLIKELQITSELRKMEDIDLVSKSTVDDLIHQKFESPLPKCQDDDDPFIKGEFDVIKELLEKVPATVEGKKKIDRVILPPDIAERVNKKMEEDPSSSHDFLSLVAWSPTTALGMLRRIFGPRKTTGMRVV